MEEKTITGYASVDKPWLRYYTEKGVCAKYPECSVFENIYQHNYRYSEDVAVEYFGKKITYKTLFENVEKTKKALISYGIKANDKVILFTSATPEMLYITLALCRIGAVANFINPLFTNEQICERINETEACLLLVLDQLYSKIEKLIKNTGIKKTVIISLCNEMPWFMRSLAGIKLRKKISYHENLISWDNFIKDGEAITNRSDEPYEKDRPLIMVYSSGTTGASKGIVLTNDGINATILHYMSPDFPYERGERFLQMIPVWFSTGIVLSVLMPVCVGITCVLEPVFSKENFVKDIAKYKTNMTLGATSLWLYAICCKELKNSDLSFLRYPITGGEQVLPRVESAINAFLSSHNCKASLLKGYGMCELGSTISTDTASVRKAGSTGFPITGVTVSAFDIETNEEKRYGERGEIRVLSPARMKEYFKNPEATEKFFYKDDGGNLWGCTGDIGYIDHEGFVYVLGRSTDYFISASGNKIYCFDIENLVMKNKNIAHCEVVGIKNKGVYVPVVHIVLEERCGLSVYEVLDDIHQNCCSELNEDCIPAGYKICKSFPVKASGKRDMQAIQEDRQGFVLPEKDSLISVEFC